MDKKIWCINKQIQIDNTIEYIKDKLKLHKNVEKITDYPLKNRTSMYFFLKLAQNS